MPTKPRKRPTIIEIAREAGVSSATVSRVINNDGYPVKEETRKRVEEVVKRKSYKLNAFGKGLSGKSNVIGVHVGAPLSVDPNFSQSAARVIDGIKSITRDRGYHVFLNVQDPLATDSQVDLLFGVPLAGVLLLAPRNDDQTISLLNEWGLPFVIIGSSGFPDCNYVDGDQAAAGAIAVRHLIQLGRRRVAFLASTDNYEPAVARERGYRTELEHESLPIRNEWIIRTQPTVEGGYEAASRILALKDRPDSIWAYNDVVAVGAIRAAHQLGYHVPRDLSIVGYDDSAIASLVQPQLTTFHHNDFEIAATGTRLLLEKVIPAGHGAKTWHELFRPKLVVRESCGGVPGIYEDIEPLSVLASQ